MQILKQLIFLLSSKERKQAVALLIMITIMAFLDMMGIASILPFITVLTNPSLIDTNVYVSILFETSKNFGIQNKDEFLVFLGFLAFAILVLSLIFKSLTIFAQTKFTQMREYSISKRIIERYINQPYDWFLDKNSSDIGKTILSEVSTIIGKGLKPLIELIAKSMISIFILCLLFLVDLKLTLVIGLLFSLSYGLCFFLANVYLKRIGKERLKNNKLRFRAINETFGATKEVKVNGLEENFINKFSDSAYIYAKNSYLSVIVGTIPKYILEAIAFGGILLLIIYLKITSGSFNNSLPIISLYIFAGYRLLPSLQQVYNSLTQLSFVGPSITKLYKDFGNLKNISPSNQYHLKKISFNKNIVLKDIYYNYPKTSEMALTNINFSINANTTVGIIGRTGSGKTTIVDLILGLIEPKKGNIKIDGKILNKENIRSWQKITGYVPQNIYLSDDTISANIAYGLSLKNVNQKDIEIAAKIANLHNFIIEELPEKYNTIIGERGIRLSGGQRQRIGIARALFHKPKLLIFDEATSALDNQTEHAVMQAVNSIRKNTTIILIAHRLETLKKCDIILKFEKGRLINVGSFKELIINNKKN